MSENSFTKVNALKGTQVFEPITVGKNELSHKVVFCPASRFRSLEDGTPSHLNLQYYKDRSQYKGSLVIAEATFVGEHGGGFPNVPGIETERHVEAWRKITNAVHKNGSFIGIQAWLLGRVAFPKAMKERGFDLVGPSAIYADEAAEKAAKEAGIELRALTEKEVHDLIYVTYANAAKNAMEAGFDYFELHAAHGYLIDQFIHPVSNHRTDKYGGSIENRARFILELIDHLYEIIGADKVAIRISPWANFQGIHAPSDTIHSITTYSYLLHELQKRANNGKKLAYVSVIEPRVNGNVNLDSEEQHGSNEWVGEVWKGIILRCGNYSYDAPDFSTLKRDVTNKRTLVGFVRYFTSNPDLVQKLHDGLDLVPYQREYFYTQNNWGYNTYSSNGDSMKYEKETEEKNIPREIVRGNIVI